jgi:hypothetical protein
MTYGSQINLGKDVIKCSYDIYVKVVPNVKIDTTGSKGWMMETKGSYELTRMVRVER